MSRRIFWCPILAVLLGGCANLKVNKVPLEKRIAHEDDCVKGFRYYLSRPYVFVSAPVKVVERKSLVVIPPQPGVSQADQRVQFLDGPRRGEEIALKDLTVPTPGTSGTRPVSAAELASIRKIVQAKADAGIQRAAHSAQEGPGGPLVPSVTVPAIEPVPRSAALRDEATYRLKVPTASLAGTTTFTPAVAPLDAAPVKTVPANTDSLTPPDLNKVSGYVAGKRQSAQLNGPIQIVFLPDMDEQYAIKSKNCLSKSAFALQFREGWQLSDVSAQHDSTAVAIGLLDTIDSAVNAAKDIGIAALPSPAPAAAAPKDVARYAVSDSNLYYLYETVYIKPGVYRLNKPWEMEGGDQPVGCGLLAKLGLTLVTECQLLSSADAATRDQGDSSKSPAAAGK